MKATGNGNTQVCVQNLLAIIRGEIPYDRIRGLDARAIDKPAADAADEIRQDAAWMLKTYEPRATVQSIQINRDAAEGGEFTVTAEIT